MCTSNVGRSKLMELLSSKIALCVYFRNSFPPKQPKISSSRHPKPKYFLCYEVDKNFNPLDMMVLTSFDLSHIKKIILSGNKLKQ